MCVNQHDCLGFRQILDRNSSGYEVGFSRRLGKDTNNDRKMDFTPLKAPVHVNSMTRSTLESITSVTRYGPKFVGLAANPSQTTNFGRHSLIISVLEETLQRVCTNCGHANSLFGLESIYIWMSYEAQGYYTAKPSHCRTNDPFPL